MADLRGFCVFFLTASSSHNLSILFILSQDGQKRNAREMSLPYGTARELSNRARPYFRREPHLRSPDSVLFEAAMDVARRLAICANLKEQVGDRYCILAHAADSRTVQDMSTIDSHNISIRHIADDNGTRRFGFNLGFECHLGTKNHSVGGESPETRWP